MLLACAALIGNLCVPQQYVAVAQFSAMYVSHTKFDQEVARRTDTEIAFWSSDSIAVGKPTGLDRICAEGWCVYYHKHCYDAFLVCTFVQSGEMAAASAGSTDLKIALHEGFSVHARSDLAMRVLLRRVRFVIHRNDDGSAVTVPLTKFEHDGGEINQFAEYRVCLTTAWAPGCRSLESH